jgi:agmatinase
MNPVGIIGIPFDEKSSFMRGASSAPDAIREVLHDGSSNYLTETGLRLEKDVHYVDHGNITVQNYPESIESGLSTLQAKQRMVSLGGDHSIAYPIVRSLAKQYDSLHLLQFDAHTDLYDSFEGDQYSHACPFARILEEGLVRQLTQVGIRTFPEEQLAIARAHDVHTITMRNWMEGERPALQEPLYISLDLDVLDPAYAPGVSHHEPGGLSPRDILEFLFQIDVPIVGADIVELNPTRDIHGMTAMVGAKFLKEIVGKIWASQ